MSPPTMTATAPTTTSAVSTVTTDTTNAFTAACSSPVQLHDPHSHSFLSSVSILTRCDGQSRKSGDTIEKRKNPDLRASAK